MSGLTGNNILAGSSGQATGYAIDQSLRFNDDDGTYLSKAAPGAAGNLNNWTLSVWLKRGQTTGLLSGSWEYQFFGQETLVQTQSVQCLFLTILPMQINLSLVYTEHLIVI